MATRSLIGVMHGDKCKAVYCHFDGYLEGVGKTLLENYDSSKANHLVALGDISVLAENIEVPADVEHSFDNRAKNITVFYGRDRGETGVDFKVFQDYDEVLDFADGCMLEYYYIMKDGVWYVADYDNRELRVLADELAKEAVEA
jgi:hypothetical protein